MTFQSDSEVADVASSPPKRNWFSWPVVALLFVAMDLGLYAKRHELIKLLGLEPRIDQPVSHRPQATPRIHAELPVTAERMEEIRKRIAYHPGKGAQRGRQTVELLVSLDGKGVVDSIDVLKGQFDPAFAAAVEKAVRTSGPFPPETSRMFSLTFSDPNR